MASSYLCSDLVMRGVYPTMVYDCDIGHVASDKYYPNLGAHEQPLGVRVLRGLHQSWKHSTRPGRNTERAVKPQMTDPQSVPRR